MKKILKACLTAFALAAVAGGASAQEYPSKPIRLVIPFTPGGGTDFVARTIGNKLVETLGWTIVFDNRAGAGGAIGVEAAAKSPADGYTIVIGQGDNMTLGPHIYKNVGYDTLRGFAPIVHMSSSPAVIVSGAGSGIATPAQMVARGKTDKGLAWATAGNGTAGHLLGEQLQAVAGIRVVQVPYKGAVPALTDTIGGQTDVATLSAGSVIPQIKSGKLVAVAVSTVKRSPVLPDTPSLEEAGLKGIDLSLWTGLFAPVGTPAPVVARINAEVNKVLQMPDVREKLASQGTSAVGGTPEAFAEFVRTDYARFGKAVKDFNVKAD